MVSVISRTPGAPAQAAADADPASARALWRLAVALYRLGRFEEAGQRLDDLLEVASRFAPGGGAAGQVKVWPTCATPRRGGPISLRRPR